MCSQVVVVLTTESDLETAKSLSDTLLKRKLAACIHFNEIHSCYWWEGELEKNKEVRIMVKTTNAKLQELVALIKDLHSYEVPQIIYWPVSSSDEYIKWIEEIVL